MTIKFEDIVWDSFQGRKAAHSIYKEIIKHDTYCLEDITTKIDTIIDIGANVGCFSVYARELFPNARIIAVEPAKTVRNDLFANLTKRNVEILTVALGDGSLMSGNEKRPEGMHLTPSEEGYPSLSLSGILKEAKINDVSKAVLKVDCEGSEHYLLNDLEALGKFAYITGEIHPHKTGIAKEVELLKAVAKTHLFETRGGFIYILHAWRKDLPSDRMFEKREKELRWIAKHLPGETISYSEIWAKCLKSLGHQSGKWGICFEGNQLAHHEELINKIIQHESILVLFSKHQYKDDFQNKLPKGFIRNRGVTSKVRDLITDTDERGCSVAWYRKSEY